MKEYTKEPRKPCEAAQESLPEDMIEGRNAVTEALRSGRTINKVFLADGDTDRALGRLAAMAKESGRRRRAHRPPQAQRHEPHRCASGHHGLPSPPTTMRRSTIFSNAARGKGRGARCIVMCDELSDPHNLGAILRTAECAGRARRHHPQAAAASA